MSLIISLLTNPTVLICIALGALIYFAMGRSNGAAKSSGPRVTPGGPGQRRKKENVDDGRPKITILFGSQTGTAETYSRILAKEGHRWGFNTSVVDLIDYDYDRLKDESMVILVVATYGEGEPTDNAREFYERILDASQSNDTFSSVKFTIFGLGNRQYKHYQSVSRALDRRMEELGGKRLFERGEGNADATIEEDFEDWKTRMWPEISTVFGTHETEEEQITKQMQVTFHDDLNAKNPAAFPQPGSAVNIDAKRPLNATILANRELLAVPAGRSTRHIELDISGANISYETGDHLGVYPQNESALVSKYAQRLNIVDDLDRVISLSLIIQSDDYVPPKFPQKTSVRNVLTWYLDLVTSPKKTALRAFAHYATDEIEKQKLTLMCSSSEEGRALYNTFIKSAYRTPLEVLEAFPSVAIPLDHFLEVTPRLLPRFYSIASSSKVYPNRIFATVALLSYTKYANTPRQHEAYGVCSAFMKNAAVGSTLPIFVRKSTFRLPINPSLPVIMVGPGTGLAPFMGFVQELEHQASKPASSDSASVGIRPATLYFGCRKSAEDFIYEKELKAACQNNVINLRLAFSREKADKCYVQHLLLQDGASTWEVLQSGGYFYVCGDAKYMAKDVDRALNEICCKHGNMTPEQAEAFIFKLQSNGRYLRDVWSPS